MKINREKELQIKTFSDYKIGEVVRSDSNYYMIIEKVLNYNDAKVVINAVNLETGELTFLDDECNITPCDVELTVN